MLYGISKVFTHICICMCIFIPYSVVEAFLQRFPECISSKDGYSHTILHCAAFQNQLDIITLAMNQVSLHVLYHYCMHVHMSGYTSIMFANPSHFMHAPPYTLIFTCKLYMCIPNKQDFSSYCIREVLILMLRMIKARQHYTWLLLEGTLGV